jgi:ribosomal protein L19
MHNSLLTKVINQHLCAGAKLYYLRGLKGK